MEDRTGQQTSRLSVRLKRLSTTVVGNQAFSHRNPMAVWRNGAAA
jgi:hypothetical protein